MEIPIEIFITGIGVSVALAIFGFIRNPQIPAMLVFGGMFILSFAVMTDSIILDSFLDGGNPDIYHYDVTSNTGQLLINAVTGSSIAERPTTSSSVLIGDEIDCITVYIGKSGTPPESTVTFGVFNVNNVVISSFGTQTVASMTSSANTPYTHCLPIGTTHVIGTSEHIGINYNAGDATNTLTMRVDANNPFDGTITDRAQYLAGWTGSSGQDVMMQMYLRGSENTTVSATFEFTEMAKVLFALIGVTMMLCGAIMVGRN